MAAILVGIALCIACVAILLLPFRRRTTTASAVVDPIEELRHEREHVYEEERRLRQDYDLGHIPEESYAARLQDYRLCAATLLQQQEHLETWEQQLEEEVLALRELPVASDGLGRCSECGEQMADGVEQCRSCGAWLPDVVSGPRRREK